MPKLRVTIIHKQTGTFDSGDMSAALVQALLEKGGDGPTFGDTNWGLADVAGTSDNWDVESIDVEAI